MDNIPKLPDVGMNDLSHLLMSLSYTPNDPRVPEAMRTAAMVIQALLERGALKEKS